MDLQKDLTKFEERKSRFAALGDDHIEIEQASSHGGLGRIVWSPLRSLYSGTEMAAMQEPNIQSLKSQIASRTARIAELLK